MGMNTETSLIMKIFLNGCQLIYSRLWLEYTSWFFPRFSTYSLEKFMLDAKDQSQSADLIWPNPLKIH